MIEIHPNLFVGSLADYQNLTTQSQWKVVQACKEPCHRDALGYKTQDAPKNHPEHLVAYRDNRIILNLVDSDNFHVLPQNIKDDINFIVETAIQFIHVNIQYFPVLIHCNWGMSRSPSIALLYLKKYTDAFSKDLSFEQAKQYFKNALYHKYAPNNSMKELLSTLWSN